MADAFCLQNSTDAGNHIVRCDSGRFIDYENSIHIGILIFRMTLRIMKGNVAKAT